MTHLDHRKPPARAARRKQGSSRPSNDGMVRKKPKRSHSAVGAAVVAAAAMVAAFAFILTNGNSQSSPDTTAGSLPEASTPTAQPKSNPAPSVASGKADRKPPSGRTSTTTKSVAPPNTGAESPAFRRGQWVAVVDTYPTDEGLPADELAKNMAAKMIAAGTPAKAMHVDGQYPGIANSNFEPVRDTWMVYLGPFPSAAAANTLCTSPQTQRAYGTLPACPTYEPTTKHN